MAKELTVFKLESNDVDLCGTWHKDDVESEMLEIGLNPADYGSWISYILSHFDFPDYVIETLEDNNVYELKFIFEGSKVHAVKY